MILLAVVLIITILLTTLFMAVKAIRFRVLENKSFTSLCTTIVSVAFYLLLILQTCPYIDGRFMSPMFKGTSADILSRATYCVFVVWILVASLCRIFTGAITIRGKQYLILTGTGILANVVGLSETGMLESLSNMFLVFWILSAIVFRIELLIRKSKYEKEKQINQQKDKDKSVKAVRDKEKKLVPKPATATN